MATQTGQVWKEVALGVSIGAGAVAVVLGVYKATRRGRSPDALVEPWMDQWAHDLEAGIEAERSKRSSRA